MTVPRPPAHVAPYVEALGAATAVQFFLHFGGAELYIPRNPKGGSELADVLGMPAALALSALAERTMLPRRVPIPKAWLARYLKVTAGLSHAEIARKLHWTDVSVRRAVAGLTDRPIEDPDQPRLI
ncbi:MAG: helix-turn-helix domain-containing protein [Cypionkella sp.]